MTLPYIGAARGDLVPSVPRRSDTPPSKAAPPTFTLRWWARVRTPQVVDGRLEWTQRWVQNQLYAITEAEAELIQLLLGRPGLRQHREHEEADNWLLQRLMATEGIVYGVTLIQDTPAQQAVRAPQRTTRIIDNAREYGGWARMEMQDGGHPSDLGL